MIEIRPPECFESEDIYRWLLAEREWLCGPVVLAQHQIRLTEGSYDRDLADAAAGRFEHDAVQLAADVTATVNPGGRNLVAADDDDDWAVGSVQG